MNVVVWTRVSTLEQKEDGYSLDAQLRSIQEKAVREGWNIVKIFDGAESAKKGAERKKFNQMMDWLTQNAKKEQIEGLVAHKIDRAARNMKDAVRLQELQDKLGIKLLFIENNFDPGPVGQFSYNILASVAQFYSDNLRHESLKGMNEKVQQGWLPTHAPYGYLNDPQDKLEPIKVESRASLAVRRIFELYSKGSMTLDLISDTLRDEGLYYQESCPRFSKQVLSYIVNNRFYIGEIRWHGRVFQGKHKPLVDVRTFETCQSLLLGKNRRKRDVNLPYAGGLFRCAHCGSALSGEQQRKRLANGEVNEHVYYRCRGKNKNERHPVVVWKTEALEKAIVEELRKLKLSPELSDWFRDTLRKSMQEEVTYRKDLMTQLRKKETELETKKSRLLDAFIGGHVQKEDYEKKAEELTVELGRVRRQMAEDNKAHEDFTEIALKAFEFSQNAAETWLGSRHEVRRQLLDILSANRETDGLKLSLTWRKPFDCVAEMAISEDGVGDWTEHVPKVRKFASQYKTQLTAFTLAPPLIAI